MGNATREWWWLWDHFPFVLSPTQALTHPTSSLYIPAVYCNYIPALQIGRVWNTQRLPWWLRGKESASQAGNMGSTPGQADHLGKGMQPTLEVSPGKSHKGAWQAAVHGGHRRLTNKTMTKTFREVEAVFLYVGLWLLSLLGICSHPLIHKGSEPCPGKANWNVPAMGYSCAHACRSLME